MSADSGSGGAIDDVAIVEGPGAPAGVAISWIFYMGCLLLALCFGIRAFLVHVVEVEVSWWPFDVLWRRVSSGASHPTWAASGSASTSTTDRDESSRRSRQEVNAAL